MKLLEIDIFDFDNTIRNMRKATAEYDMAMKLAKQDLRKSVRSKLTRDLIKYGVPTWASDDIDISYIEDGIVIDFPDAMMFVEFGAGLRGQSHPHPNPSFDPSVNAYDDGYTDYNTGVHSSVVDKFGQKGFFPFPMDGDVDGKNWRTIDGFSSKPIIHDLQIYVEERVPKIYEKHLKEAGF